VETLSVAKPCLLKQKRMQKFSYKIDISAASEKEAITKMKALTVLASKLKDKELEKLAYIIQNDPIKTAMAKTALGV
jgi:hypothetical protein